MMKPILILFFILSCFLGHSQINYHDYKARYEISCGWVDSVTLITTQALLDSIDRLTIVEGEGEFLFDKGWTYYRRYMKWKQTEDVQIAADAFEQAWLKYGDVAALWNLGGMYTDIDCKKAIEYTEAYIKEAKTAPELDVDYKQVYYRYSGCWSQR